MFRKLAMIIGNSEYQDQRLARLSSPRVDVDELAAVLRAPNVGAFSEVRPLLNQPAAIVRREIASFFAATSSRDDLLLLYFSGHGIKSARGELYLAVADTETHLLGATAIPASFISEEMDNSWSRRLVLVLDCCHSGAFLRGAKGAVGDSVDTRGAFEGSGSGRVILTATDSTQYAWEGDTVSGEAQTSMFTHFLIEGLKTGAADEDSDGAITVDELYKYVHGRVVARTPNQKPQKFVINQQGDVVIAMAPLKPVELSHELREAMHSAFLGARLDAVRELERGIRGEHPGRRLAAERALRELAQDDSRRVATAARSALEGQLDEHPPAPSDVTEPTPQEPEPVSTAARPIPSKPKPAPFDDGEPATQEPETARPRFSIRPGGRLMGAALAAFCALVAILPLGLARSQFDASVVSLVVAAAVGLAGGCLMRSDSRVGKALGLASLAVILVAVAATAAYRLAGGRPSAVGTLSLGALAVVALALAPGVVLAHEPTGESQKRTPGRRSIALAAVAGSLAIAPGAYAYFAHPPIGAGLASPSQRREASLPASRQEATAVAAGRKLYIIGGIFGGSKSQSTTFVFDGGWHEGPSLPIGIDHASGGALGSTVYIAGGFIDLSSASARAFRLDGDHWQELAPMHHARGAAALVAISSRLYAIGGSTVHNAGEQVAAVEAYDPGANIWTDVSSLPQPRNHLAGFAYGSLACVAGGRSAENTAAIDCYDAATSGWSAPFPPLPTPTSAGGAGVLESEVVVAGGEKLTPPAQILGHVMRLRGGSWQSEPMLVPRQALTLAPYGNRLWACGGGIQVDNVNAVSDCTSISR